MAPIVGQGLDYSVDIVMCIDATGSMDGIIEEVKSNALSFRKGVCKATRIALPFLAT